MDGRGPKPKVVLWTGPKHSGKSTAAKRLVDKAAAEDFPVAGILAPAIYRQGILVGFDVVDVATDVRQPLARRTGERDKDVGPFAFRPEGLHFGNAALGSTRRCLAALVVVDEFGPLELRGKGWRRSVDQLISDFRGTLLLVVRKELTSDVTQLYSRWNPQCVSAADPDAIDRVLRTLRRQSPGASPPAE